MNSRINGVAGLVFFCSLVVSHVAGQTPHFVPFSAAQPVLNAYMKSLPAELKPSGQATAAAWNEWVRNQDKEIRVRIEQGEENTLTNLLRLGVTYTKEPRITYDYLAEYGHSSFVDAIADRRANDLIRALAASHPGEGMLEMRALLQRKGYSLNAVEDQKKVKAYLLANLARLRDDVDRDKRQAKANPYQAFKDRGISTDSNLYPDYTIDLALRHMMDQGLLKPGSVHRVAIVGPGLDFVNKKAGSDFYPPQTTQPFAVVDSLARLGLADPDTIEVYTFDISSRVNRHLERARRDAATGKPYTIQLLASPSDGWGNTYKSGFLEYWQKLGSQVGKPAKAIPVPEEASDIWNRAISVRPSVVRRVTPIDMNVVFQTLSLPPERRFDLIIGTNIFVYYGGLEQSLARANLGTMLRPGGFLLTNEALPGAAPSNLTDSLKTSVPITTDPPLTDYMFSYVRRQ
ncbi:MAG TPA: hypothetical protein VL240_00080 [Candidatus Binatia bacterium]|nr:hypothetical protein [Candidatus Binatia bacterium]